MRNTKTQENTHRSRNPQSVKRLRKRTEAGRNTLLRMAINGRYTSRRSVFPHIKILSSSYLTYPVDLHKLLNGLWQQKIMLPQTLLSRPEWLSLSDKLLDVLKARFTGKRTITHTNAPSVSAVLLLVGACSKIQLFNSKYAFVEVVVWNYLNCYKEAIHHWCRAKLEWGDIFV